MTKILFIAVLSITSSSLYALGGGFSLEDGLFWGADLDRNEQLDRDEAKAIYNLGNAQVFSKYDTSGEGLITKLEFYDYLRRRGKNE